MSENSLAILYVNTYIHTLSRVLFVLGKFGDFYFEYLTFFILAILHLYSLIVQSLTVSDCFIKEYSYNKFWRFCRYTQNLPKLNCV